MKKKDKQCIILYFHGQELVDIVYVSKRENNSLRKLG
jgi:hypothetical protein